MEDQIQSIRQFTVDSGFSGVIRWDQAGQTPLFEAFGYAHRGFEVANAIDTQIAIASGGKTFTALAVVSLIVDGALSLHTTARSVLGDDLPLIADDVTVEHLLAHTSGVGDYLDEEADDYDLDDYPMKSPVHRLNTTEAFLSEVDGYPTKFKAGDRFSYCNGGYIVLALIAERSSGVPYHDLVEARVLKPAGLTDTAFLRSDEPSGRMALGYLHAEGLRANILHMPVRGNGDGGIYTTAADIHTFWNVFFAGRIVPDEWVQEMTQPGSEVPEKKDGRRYGLGFWLDQTGPAAIMAGGDTGASFYSVHDPTVPSTWTVLSNTTEGAWPVVEHLELVLQGVET